MPTSRTQTPFGPGLVLEDVRFENGLRLLALADHSAPVVSFQSWFRVGSRDEKKGKTGIAHFLEHLMFKETKNHPLGEFDRLIELGGGEVNAATWTDWTCYYENVPKATFPLAVELEADRLTNLALDPKEVDSEREVVMNERRWSVDGDVEGKGTEALYLSAYQEHPYRWPTIGFMQDIRGLTQADCEAFYRANYAPNNLTLVAVGDLKVDDVVKLIGHHYGKIPAAPRRRRKPKVEAVQTRARRKTLKLETDACKTLLGYRGPAYGSSAYQAVLIMKEVLAGSRSARLSWRMVHEEEMATDVSFDPTPFEHPGLIEVAIEGREGVGCDALVRVYQEELDRFLRDGVTPEELDAAKNRIELSVLTGLETASGKADQIGFDATVLGEPGATFSVLQGIQNMTADKVLDVAREHLSKQKQTRVDIVPKETP